MGASDDDSSGDELEDALRGVFSKETVGIKKTLTKHQKVIDELVHDVDMLKKRTANSVDIETYRAENAALRAEVREAMAIAREARSEQAMQAPLLRDELLRLLRDELQRGLSAQHALANAHAKAIAELQSTGTGHEGRLAAIEAAVNLNGSSAQRLGEELQSKLISMEAQSAAKLLAMQDEINQAREAARLAQEQEKLAR